MDKKIEPTSGRSLPASLGGSAITDGTLRDELKASEALFNAQPRSIQRFLEAQVNALSGAVEQRLPQVRFSLPDQVVVHAADQGEGAPVSVPAEHREQMAGGLVGRLTHGDFWADLRQPLAGLPRTDAPAVAASAMLLRYAGVIHMVYDMLPAGRNVRYHEPADGGIPNEPVDEGLGSGGGGGRQAAASCSAPTFPRRGASTCLSGWRSTRTTASWWARWPRPRRTSPRRSVSSPSSTRPSPSPRTSSPPTNINASGPARSATCSLKA